MPIRYWGNNYNCNYGYGGCWRRIGYLRHLEHNLDPDDLENEDTL